MKQLNELSAAERRQLMEELRIQEEQAQASIRAQRDAYKELVAETIPPLLTRLQAVSGLIQSTKQHVFDSLQTLITLKGEAYGRKGNQFSHSFTTAEGVNIMIGWRVDDDYDDTVNAGLEKVHHYIESLATDEKSQLLVKAILRLLSKDTKGNLQSGRVLALSKMADQSGDADFIDGMRIIRDAYQPKRSKSFVTCRYTNSDGDKVQLPLSFTDADIQFSNNPEKSPKK